MIQRIQSIYLAVGMVILSIFLISPICKLNIDDNSVIDFYSYGFKTMETENKLLQPTFGLFIAGTLSLVLFGVILFLYRKRILQIRLCLISILLLMVTICIMAYSIIKFESSHTVISKNFSIWAVAPIVNIILAWLAFRSIRQDENLVKSYDRLR